MIYLDRIYSDMQMYTRPLEKLTSNTVSLEIIIVKAIYDTAFIHTKICPGALFLQFGLMTDSTPPPLPCSPRQPRPHRTRKERIKPRWGRSSPSSAPGEPPPQGCRGKRRSDTARENATVVLSKPRAHDSPSLLHGMGCFYQGLSCASSPRAGRGKQARWPTLRHCNHTPSPMLRTQPCRQLHPTFNILAGHQARILQNPGRGRSSPLPGYPGEDGDCPWDCPWASERRGQ